MCPWSFSISVSLPSGHLPAPAPEIASSTLTPFRDLRLEIQLSHLVDCCSQYYSVISFIFELTLDFLLQESSDLLIPLIMPSPHHSNSAHRSHTISPSSILITFSGEEFSRNSTLTISHLYRTTIAQRSGDKNTLIPNTSGRCGSCFPWRKCLSCGIPFEFSQLI
jgi:hypothetical protein